MASCNFSFFLLSTACDRGPAQTGCSARRDGASKHMGRLTASGMKWNRTLMGRGVSLSLKAQMLTLNGVLYDGNETN